MSACSLEMACNGSLCFDTSAFLPNAPSSLYRVQVSARAAQRAFGRRTSLGALPATAAKVPKPETAALWAKDHRWKLLGTCGFYLCQRGVLLWPPFSAGGPVNLTPSHYFLL